MRVGDAARGEVDAVAADDPLAAAVELDLGGELRARLRLGPGELPAQRVALDLRGAELRLVAREVVDDVVAALRLDAVRVVVEGEDQ